MVYVGKLKVVPDGFVGEMYDVLPRPDDPVEGVAIAMVEVGVVATVQISKVRVGNVS